MNKIVFATYDEVSGLNGDDSALLDSASDFSISATTSSWSNGNTNWSEFDAVIVRSTWDYYKRYPEFLNWLNVLQSTAKAVWNPVSVIKWNSDKRYLEAFSSDGIRIIPTKWLDHESLTVSEIMKANKWEKAVAKPAVSAGSYHTYTIDRNNAASVEQDLSSLKNSHSFMVQPFMSEIVTEGEWSLLFFNGKYSHAVLKTPKSGDFRVQPKYGSTVKAAEPNQHIISQATEIIRYVKEPLLYARVDGVIRNGEFYLMELELIEPMLFLGYSADADKRFLSAIAERLS